MKGFVAWVRGALGAIGVLLLVSAAPPPTGAAVAETEVNRAADVSDAAQADQSSNCIERSACCKICTKGKACGDTCIRASYTCHKGRGCACDAEEICE